MNGRAQRKKEEEEKKRERKGRKDSFSKRVSILTNKPKGVKLMPWSPKGLVSVEVYLYKAFFFFTIKVDFKKKVKSWILLKNGQL